MEYESHEHCENCVKLYCSAPSGCKMLLCEYGCGAQLHGCKMKDHKNVCQKCRIPCINSDYGCPAVITRDILRSHLQHCPASVIFCTMEWNRYPVYSKARLSWVPFFQPNPVLVKGHLDVELAFRDQRILRDVFRRRCKKGKAKVELLRTSPTNTPKQHGSNNGNLPALKSDSRKLAMALALSSLENKLRTQHDGGEYSGGETENESFLEAENDHVSKNVCDVFSEERLESSDDLENTHTEIELHRLQLAEDDDTKGVEQEEAPFSCYDSDIPPPPNHLPIYLDKPLGLNVVVETLPKFQKQLPMYSIPCNQVFRRDEYSGHFKNVHSDIQGGLNGWLEHRCPLAQYGCTFVRYRLLPHSQNGAVIFDQELGSFGIRPCDGVNSVGQHASSFTESTQECSTELPAKNSLDLLTSLPLEILEKIASHLDGFSLCNFSCTCKLVREICRNVLETKGMVVLEWEKRIYDTGSWSWRIRQKVGIYNLSTLDVNNKITLLISLFLNSLCHSSPIIIHYTQ